ncbi:MULTISPECIES: flagellin [unclassified Hydrogenobaculum]|uniref:flagellin N-terminal helical domain-containing protein n=1 Tax=unclassified Hydrogenobaculum TaxID=2622382 RepID=UPI0001C5132A|nr:MULTISPECIES: flagellin [unclassified Hydrogenobaculum]AEF19640.1 flagellin domain protein [Hydrogenobaculum sp. 3684]AEG46928.1 flagellin domain protein [Hydrogenobaculum sp. SHO]AGG15575.1 flagellin domain protein [Hydrogenobaculum sp. HO]AGH93874.1 flagellin/flagellar hook associated protein [Hydrogenobaculum sp. SN]
MLSINFNYGALVANNALQQANQNVTNDITHISTGLRILSAADDPAGLFIADQLHTLGTALGQGYLNTQQGYSLAQVADGQLSQIYNTLNTMYTYAVNAANSTNNINSAGALQNQISALAQSIKEIVNTTTFNGKKLFDGSFINQAIQFGGQAGQYINISIGNLSIERMGAAIAQTGDFQNINNGSTAANIMAYYSGSGPITVNTTASATTYVGANTTASQTVITSDVLFDGNKQLFINGNEVVASAYASATNAYLDAHIIANNINSVFNGTVTAQASNTLQGTQAFGTIQVASSATVSIVISRQVEQSSTVGVGFTALTNAAGQPEQLANGQYVGIVSQTINLVGGQTYSLQDIISAINGVATNTGVYATTDSTGQYLQLYTTDGSTFQININVTNSNTASQATYGLNLAKFGAVQPASLDGTASATYGAIVSVGSLQITSPSNLQIAAFGQGANANDNLINNLVFNTPVSNSYINGYSSTNTTTINGSQTVGYNYFVKDLLDINVTTTQGANQAQIILQNAINYVDTIRAQVGAVMQQMQTLANGDQTGQTNTLNAEAAIRDLNISQAMTQYQNDNTLQQSAIAMLAQANAIPQQLLTLFR